MSKRPEQIRPFRQTTATHSRTTVATDIDTVLLPGANCIYRSIQVIGTTGSIRLACGSATVTVLGDEIGDVLNPAAAGTTGGDQWETTQYMGAIALRAIGAPVTISVLEV